VSLWPGHTLGLALPGAVSGHTLGLALPGAVSVSGLRALRRCEGAGSSTSVPRGPPVPLPAWSTGPEAGWDSLHPTSSTAGAEAAEGGRRSRSACSPGRWRLRCSQREAGVREQAVRGQAAWGRQGWGGAAPCSLPLLCALWGRSPHAAWLGGWDPHSPASERGAQVQGHQEGPQE